MTNPGRRRTADKVPPRRVTAEPNPNPPVSIRFSVPLLERLDRLAARQHRTRSNLIQHVLWEYVHANEGDLHP